MITGRMNMMKLHLAIASCLALILSSPVPAQQAPGELPPNMSVGAVSWRFS